MTVLTHSGVGSGVKSVPFCLGDKIPSGSGVYFVRAMGYIKVGYTGDFAARLEAIGRMMPEEPEVLAFVLGPRSVETTIHRVLKAICLKNEWYPDCEAVREILADAQAGRIQETCRGERGVIKPVKNEVRKASEAFKAIAAPVGRDEPIRSVIQRAAVRAGLGYWRAFDLWYAKARTVGADEMDAIKEAARRPA